VLQQKLTLLALFVYALPLAALCQGVGINEPNPHPRALLELQANDRGLRVTQLTTAERDAMLAGLTPADSVELQGLVIFNTSTQCLEYFNRHRWISMCNNTPPCPNRVVAVTDNAPCTGLPLTLTATANPAPVGTIWWNWTGPNGWTSTAQNPTVTASAGAIHSGNYTVAVTSNGCTSSPTTHLVTVQAPDATVCTGGPNLIVNGDFEAGITGFTTDYSFSACVGAAATYNTIANPRTCNGAWCNMGDHTTGTGLMMVANGSTTVQNMWCQTVAVSPGTTYNFSFWGANVCQTCGDTPRFRVRFNGVDNPDACSSITLPTCSWGKYNTRFTTGPAETSLTLCIQNVTLAAGGNDFGIDDVQLVVCP
jgi:hypothetical protein